MSLTYPYNGFDEAAFDAFVHKTLDEFPAPGLAVTTVNCGRVWTRCYGQANRSTKQPVSPTTLFPINSITKSFTAAVCGGIVESPTWPQVKWQTPLSALIPGLAIAEGTELGDWATRHATFEDALAHRLGLTRHDMARANGDPSVPDLVHSLRYVGCSSGHF
jgi:CubicO group peptidase (beta-lactamase class C family)